MKVYVEIERLSESWAASSFIEGVGLGSGTGTTREAAIEDYKTIVAEQLEMQRQDGNPVPDVAELEFECREFDPAAVAA